MSDHERDLTESGLPSIDAGHPVFRGWVHDLNYRVSVNIGVGDKLVVDGAVPSGEQWNVVNFSVCDRLLGLSGEAAWKQLGLQVAFPAQMSPVATAADRTPSGAWTLQVGFSYYPPLVWSESWDGTSYIGWGHSDNPRVVAAGVDMSRQIWPAGTRFRLRMEDSEAAAAAEYFLTLRLNVVRFRSPDQDLRRLTAHGRSKEQVLLQDVHDLVLGAGR